ncbi:MAG TPA: NAD(P)H-binding protein [Streptosporangiaceae bacterium]|jgi:uncharacterized protein YbjT (DUF2867 family)
MRIAIAGGTGTLGGHVAAELTARGHEVRVLSRSSREFPVDLTTGSGLERALAGCAAVVDASNATSAKRAEQVLVQGSRRLLAAELVAGVDHHVCISIVGCERVPFGYYRVKMRQEELVHQGSVPYSLVRATQFHELAAMALAAAGKWRVLPIPPMRLQTVAAAEVARAVADVAADPSPVGQLQVAGPEVSTAAGLARTWKEVTGRAALLVPVPLPGKIGRVLREGGLTTDHPDVRGTTTFADWLRATLH